MSEAVVTGTTVLIYLAKLGDLGYLDDCFEHAFVPQPVYDEAVTQGREERYADAMTIDDACGEFLTVRSLSEETTNRAARIMESAGLGRGESAAIAFALERDARCLTDDHAARKTVESLGAEVGGTIFVLLSALSDGRISFEEYVASLDDLTDEGFRISASLYRRAVEAGRELD
jgi:predicted nucleic acid-binding protein